MNLSIGSRLLSIISNRLCRLLHIPEPRFYVPPLILWYNLIFVYMNIYDVFEQSQFNNAAEIQTFLYDIFISDGWVYLLDGTLQEKQNIYDKINLYSLFETSWRHKVYISEFAKYMFLQWQFVENHFFLTVNVFHWGAPHGYKTGPGSRGSTMVSQHSAQLRSGSDQGCVEAKWSTENLQDPHWTRIRWKIVSTH